MHAKSKQRSLGRIRTRSSGCSVWTGSPIAPLVMLGLDAPDLTSTLMKARFPWFQTHTYAESIKNGAPPTLTTQLQRVRSVASAVSTFQETHTGRLNLGRVWLLENSALCKVCSALKCFPTNLSQSNIFHQFIAPYYVYAYKYVYIYISIKSSKS